MAGKEADVFGDTPDIAAREVAHHIARSASGRFDMEATISVSDEGWRD